MVLEPEMRVRCVMGGCSTGLIVGGEYVVRKVTHMGTVVQLKGMPIAYSAYRFKPVIRVKAICVPEGMDWRHLAQLRRGGHY